METFIYVNAKKNIDDVAFEVVETKGMGHPDNICDALAEKISANYSKYCLSKYGVILRHMIDKLSVLGGGSKVWFQGGEITSPIRVLVNGRFTSNFNNDQIDYMKIVNKTIKTYFKKLFPLLNVEKDLIIVDNTHHNEGPGVVYNDDGTTLNERKRFFEVVSKEDLHRHNNHFKCNDTSTTVSYSPMSKLEKLVLDIEKTLNSSEYKKKNPWTGSDIKVMGIRKGSLIEITSCVPLISKYVLNLDDYKEKLNKIKKDIAAIIENYFDGKYAIYLNTRDNYEKNDMYMTVIGSAIESGDEGAVGRGNRPMGVIPFSRHFSMEASCGKNPVYHTGKIFSAIGNEISKAIYDKYHVENIVYMTSKMGDEMENPWNVSVELNEEVSMKVRTDINKIVNKYLKKHYDVTKKIIDGKIKLNNY